MGALVPFAYGDALVRVVEVSGDPWWVAGDVAKVLGYSHVPHMLRVLDEDEKGVRKVDTLGGSQDMTIISESGVYHAIFKSRRAEAKHFRKWVTTEVLPSIRKNGFYLAPTEHVATAAAGPWELMERRIEQLERLLTMQERVETTAYARVTTYTPSLLDMKHDGSQRLRQRRFRWWHDVEVREAAIRHHLQMTIDQARLQISVEFGAARAPSRSSLGRFWLTLTKNRRTH
ncbi:MAG TPA: BRO family protein [Sphingobium sp.]